MKISNLVDLAIARFELINNRPPSAEELAEIKSNNNYYKDTYTTVKTAGCQINYGGDDGDDKMDPGHGMR